MPTNGFPARRRVTKGLLPMTTITRDWTVARRGTDTSGRGIFASAFFWFVWLRMLADPRLDAFRDRIVVVQGPWMIKNGGGAVASAGYHDRGGCIDVRTWNLTLAEQAILWAVAAEYGFWFWKRDLAPAHGGMDEHGHAIAGWDHDLASGAAIQWTQARNGRDGLASNGPDYMVRRGPLVEFPPDQLLQEDDMFSDADRSTLNRIERGLGTFRSNELERDKRAAEKANAVAARQIAALGGLADRLTELANDTKDDATRQELQATRAAILKALADDPDVDGPDNPAPTEQ